MQTEIILLILAVHWIADFVLQTHEESVNKSKDWYFLLKHTYKYSIVWLFSSFFILNHYVDWYTALSGCYVFFMITFVAHTATDAITSRITSKLWQKQDFHNFFVVIGFDQLLHFAQLFYTFKFIIEHA